MSAAPQESAERSAWELPELLGLTADLDRLHEFSAEWVEDCDPEVQPMVRRQLSARAKYFRPVTVFACYHAMTHEPLPARVLRAAAAVELIHNVSLIVDDILDRSRYRRGELSMHCRYGFLPALMTAGYMGFAAPAARRDGCLQRAACGRADAAPRSGRMLPVAPSSPAARSRGLAAVAGADTGTMFEICARARDARRPAARSTAGCSACSTTAATTSPMSVARRARRREREGHRRRDPDPPCGDRHARSGNALPCSETLAGRHSARSASALRAALPEAEVYLDRLAAEAEDEAVANAPHPARLVELVRHTRALSSV